MRQSGWHHFCIFFPSRRWKKKLWSANIEWHAIKTKMEVHLLRFFKSSWRTHRSSCGWACSKFSLIFFLPVQRCFFRVNNFHLNPEINTHASLMITYAVSGWKKSKTKLYISREVIKTTTKTTFNLYPCSLLILFRNFSDFIEKNAAKKREKNNKLHMFSFCVFSSPKSIEDLEKEGVV